MVISWRIQAALTVLLGPCLIAGYGFLPPKLEENIRDTQYDFLVATSILSASVSVATSIYIFDATHFVEITFLYYLATMQVFSFLTVWFAVTPRYSEDPRMEWPALCFAVASGSYILLFVHILVEVFNFAIPEFLSACINHGLPTSTPEFESSLDLMRAYEVDWLMMARSTKSIITSVFIVAWAPAAFTFFERTHGWRYHRQLRTLVSGGVASGMGIFMVKMERNRSMGRALAGKSYVGDDIGFGQILAIFICIPTLLRIFLLSWLVQHTQPAEIPVLQQVGTHAPTTPPGFGRTIGEVLTFG